MSWAPEELRQRIAAIPDHDKEEIIYNVAWSIFGEIADDESEYVVPSRKPTDAELRDMVVYLRDALTEERPELTVKEVIRSGELEISPGHTREEIIELACECLNAANSWDICGEVLFVGSDGQHYCGTVEFVIGLASPEYVKTIAAEHDDEEETE